MTDHPTQMPHTDTAADGDAPPVASARNRPPISAVRHVLHDDGDSSKILWFLIVLPVALVYTLIARELAGPGYTTSVNQGAMVVFMVLTFAWPVLAVITLFVIQLIIKTDGQVAFAAATLCWAVSCAIPFAIGMK